MWNIDIINNSFSIIRRSAILLMIIIDDEQNIIAAVYQENHKRMLYVSAKILGHTRGEESVHDAFIWLIEKNQNNFSKLRDKPALFYAILATPTRRMRR